MLASDAPASPGNVEWPAASPTSARDLSVSIVPIAPALAPRSAVVAITWSA
jgi:hypothetical protein